MATFVPREAIGPDNYSPVVNIVTWILLVSMVLAVCTKVAMKVIGRHTFNIDDSILVAAMVILFTFFALSQLRQWSICVRSSTLRNRLLSVYRHTMALDVPLNPSRLRKWRHTRRFHTLEFDVHKNVLTRVQAGYSADLLYITALAISKVSVLVLLWKITPVDVHRRVTLGVGSFIAAWTLASFFASAFQCSVPDTWMILSQHCFDRVWIADPNVRTFPLYDTAYTPADLILDSLRCN